MDDRSIILEPLTAAEFAPWAMSLRQGAAVSRSTAAWSIVSTIWPV